MPVLGPLLGEFFDEIEQVGRELAMCTDHEPLDVSETLQTLLYRPQRV